MRRFPLYNPVLFTLNYEKYPVVQTTYLTPLAIISQIAIIFILHHHYCDDKKALSMKTHGVFACLRLRGRDKKPGVAVKLNSRFRAG